MTERRKSSTEDDRLVQDEQADPVERATSVSLLAVDRRYEFEPLFAGFLQHASPFLRGEAIQCLLGFWGKPEYFEQAVRLLRSDSEWSVRMDAAFALSQFARYTGEQRERIVRELVRALLEDDESGVQKQCYQGLLQLLAPERSLSTIPADFERERDVDWDLLKPYLDAQKA